MKPSSTTLYSVLSLFGECFEQNNCIVMVSGFRFTTEKHEASKAFAKEKGLPVLNHHLTPRTRGFISSLPYLRKKVPAIYNVILGFNP